jgi:ribosomal protein L28
MDQHYSFLSDDEPTDEQLAWLMHEVGEEVRRSGAETKRKFREELHQQVVEAQERWAKMMAGTKDDA